MWGQENAVWVKECKGPVGYYHINMKDSLNDKFKLENIKYTINFS